MIDLKQNTRRERALLVGCSLKTSSRNSPAKPSLSLNESLDELASLTDSAGGVVVDRVAQEREHYDPAFLIGRGKLAQVVDSVREHNVDLVVFDENLSPAQQRNIERKVGCRVIDRTQLILDIFADRASTREGKLQVELAQLDYLLPRLAGRGVELSRLGGGIGTRGPGETKLESDLRKIHQRIHKIKSELERVRAHRGLHRQARSGVPIATVSLVGYTNAGKSTLFNSLTQAGALASSRLFATLDPLHRRIVLPSKREIILADTVGFIHKLPPTLISAFRATLEEIGEADLLVHVIDVSNLHSDQQCESVRQVLADLKIASKPILEVYNKVDLLHAPFSSSHRNAVVISASKKIGIETLLSRIDQSLDKDPLIRARFVFDQKDGQVLSKLYSCSRLVRRSFTKDQVHVEVEAPQSVIQQLREFRRER